jgi:hypothetical protein
VSPKAATSLGIGIQGLEVAELNAALRANGLPEMSELGLTTGLATEIRFGSWELSFSGSRVSGGDEENATWRTRTSGSALTLGLGFAVIDAGRWRILPTGGFGLTRIKYHIEQVRAGPLDSALADPLRGADLDGQTWAWQAGVDLDYRVGKYLGRTMFVAARVGVIEGVGESDWRADDNDLSSGPRGTYGGVYARIGLSLGIPKRQGALIPALVSVVPWLQR